MDNIVIEDLNKNYNEEIILDNFSCRIERKRFNGIVGRSGIGKTTLLNIIMGLEKADSGIIKNMPKTISPVFQENRLLENFNVYENINFVNKDLSKEMIDKELKSLGLSNVGNKKVKNLSGGMKRRISILRGILKKSEVYVFDEPFKEMDLATYLMVLEYVRDKLFNETVIFTTHKEEEIVFFKAKKIEI